MKRRIAIRRVAEYEIEETIVWYESRLPGLGDEFRRRLGECLYAIADFPESAAILQRTTDTRRRSLRRFPYGVLYRTEGDVVRVLAVMHLHRDPTVWVERSR